MIEQLRPGVRVKIGKYRGEEENIVGRVVEVRDMHKRPIDKKTHRDRVMTRSQYLIVVERDGEPPTGERKVKSYYHAFAEVVVL